MKRLKEILTNNHFYISVLWSILLSSICLPYSLKLFFLNLIINFIIFYTPYFRVVKITLIVLSIISSMLQLGKTIYNGQLIDSYFWNTLQASNMEESGSFFHAIPRIGLIILILYILSILILIFYSFFLYSKKTKPRKKTLFMSTLNCSCIFIFFSLIECNSILYNSLSTIATSNIFNPVITENIKMNSFKLSNTNNKIKIMVIIGESATRDRMSFFGYKRKTTPYLDNDKSVIAYKNNTTTGINTQPNVTTLLTGLVGSQVKNINQDIFISAKKSKFRTTVIDNNSFRSSDILYKLKSSSDFYTNLNTIEYKNLTGKELDNKIQIDSAVLNHFNKHFVPNEGGELLLVHLMGSHPEQRYRYPENFNTFNSCYDNSILYNDYIVHNLTNNFLSLNKEFPVVIIYVSDHGIGLPTDKDDVNPVKLDNDAYGANDKYLSNFNNPLLFIANNSFKKSFPIKYNNLIKNRNNKIDQRFLFYSISDLMGFTEINNTDISNFSLFSKSHDYYPRIYSGDENTDEIINELKKQRMQLPFDTESFPLEKEKSSMLLDFSNENISYYIDYYKGLSGPEWWGRWSDSKLNRKVELKIPLLPRNFEFKITARGFSVNGKSSARIDIGNHAYTMNLSDTDKDFTFNIKNNDSDSIFITPEKPLSPKDLGLSNDDRELGIGISKIQISILK